MSTPANSHPTDRRRAPRRFALVGIVAALLLLAAACGGDGEAASSDGDLAVEIMSPTDGSDVGQSFEVELDTSVLVGEPDTGRHHVHLYYDGATGEGDYDIVYGNAFTVTRLAPGEHQMEAVIANADHSLTEARQAITINVTDDASPDSGTPDESAPAADDGYGY